MDQSEAAGQLAMVDRILANADTSIRIRGTLFILWGLVAALLDLTIQAAISFPAAAAWWWWVPVGAAYAAAVATQIWYVAKARRCAWTINRAEEQFIRLIWISVIAGFVVNVGAWRVFTGWGEAAIWSVCFAIPLMFVGVAGQRAALAGSAVLLASVVAANFFPHAVGIVLALGFVVGYSGVGVAFELARARHG